MSNASDYADSLAADIAAQVKAGFPFGVTNADTGEWARTPDGLGWHEWNGESGMDYLSDVLDIQYLVNADRTYRSARILIAFGGPTAWIDTRTGQLEVSWWSAAEVRDLPSEFIDGLDDALREMWEMGL